MTKKLSVLAEGRSVFALRPKVVPQGKAPAATLVGTDKKTDAFGTLTSVSIMYPRECRKADRPFLLLNPCMPQMHRTIDPVSKVASFVAKSSPDSPVPYTSVLSPALSPLTIFLTAPFRHCTAAHPCTGRGSLCISTKGVS